ncbi:MAG: protein of unknown function with transrane region [Candidatus Kaiserbacteria bacterium]|nr:protein of unknown function with transrane region [Candidatus Kaiserbacteria bacterium]
MPVTKERIILQWSTYEHEHVEREDEWYWGMAIIAVSLAVVSVIFGDLFFALVIIMAAVSLALVSRHPPELTHFEISDRGVRVGRHLHRYDEIIAFWVEDEHEAIPLLLIDTIKPLTPNIIIPIVDVDSHQVRALMKEHSNEQFMKEPLAHKILEFFGL